MSNDNQDHIVGLESEGANDLEPIGGNTVEQSATEIVGKNHDAELSGDKVRVTFHEQDGEGGDRPIFASLNFYAYHIPRNVPVDIPVELLKVFEDANTRVISTNDKGGVSERNVKRFSYAVHGRVVPAATGKQKKKAA